MGIIIRDARPSDAPFLAECIFAGMHLYDFEKIVNDDLADAMENITQSEGREDTLYTYSRTRLADSDYPHLIRLYESIGFVHAEHRHAFGSDYLRMIYTV